MNKLNIEIPEEVYQILGEIEEKVWPSYTLYVAGGFLRDTYGNRPIKDLDIIVVPTGGGSPKGDYKDIKELVRGSESFDTTGVFSSDYIVSMGPRGLSGVIMGYCPTLGMEAQLIVYDHHMTPSEVARDMDLNICQVVLHSYDEVICTDEFLEGFQTKTIKVLNGLDQPEREAERVRRIHYKYPDFMVVESTKQTLSDLSKE